VIVVAVAVYARRRIVNRPERFSSKGPAEAPAAHAAPAEAP
jgi:ribose transport system permease protein